MMSVQHKDLTAGRWAQLPFLVQMANIGSEVTRALNWQAKNNAPYSNQAFERALELLDLSLKQSLSYARLKELARLRETIVDYFFGDNQFKSSDKILRQYFDHFTYASRRNY